MPSYHPGLQAKWTQYGRDRQLLMICNELNRAKNMLSHDHEFKQAIYRALELMDLSSDPSMGVHLLRELRCAREVMAGFLTVRPDVPGLEKLIKVLVSLDARSFKLLYGKQRGASL